MSEPIISKHEVLSLSQNEVKVLELHLFLTDLTVVTFSGFILQICLIHCTASAEALAWSTAKFHWHGAHVQINEKFERKIINILFPVSFNMFWVLKRTVSLRRFFRVPTTYVFVEK